MSSLKKLSIHGVRSFGPHTEDTQIIQFFTPLTLILGPNGTGKTTIIECLKYITTGDLPPNSGRGGSFFIHDPKLANEIDVKAQVRLKFQDTSKKAVEITRSIVATQKKKKTEVRTLEGTIKRKGIDGKDISLSHRCGDLNREMITCLGVSKAILNNVIFCHQEDSSWPLSEGKQLKQKFDDIFAATRFIKALESIRKIHSELNNELKIFHKDIQYLKQNKEQATKIREDLEKCEVRFTVSKDTVKKIKENLVPVKESLQQIVRKEGEISKLQNEIDKQEIKLIEVGKNIKQLKEGVTKDFSGTTEELKESIRDFELRLEHLKTELMQSESSVERKKQQLERLGKERSKLLLQIGKLKHEAEHHKELIRKRDEKLKAYSEIHGFEGFIFKKDEEISESRVSQILEMLNSKIEAEKKQQRDLKQDYETKEDAAQEKINDFRDKKTKLEQAINMKADQMARNKTELRKIDQELQLLDASEAKLSQIDCELHRAEQEVVEADSSLNIQQMRSELDKLKTDRNSLETDMRKLDLEMQRMHLQSSTQAELDLLRKDKINKTDLIKKLFNKHEEALNQILGHIPNDNIAKEIKEFIRQIGNECRNLSSELQKLKINSSSAENKRKMWMDQLKKKEDELKGFEEKIFQICGSQDFDSSLSVLQSSLKELQDEKGAIVGTQYIYKKYIEKLGKPNPCCPLCRREFDDDQDVTELVSDLSSKLNLIPNQLEMKQKTLLNQEKKHNSMLELKPFKAQIVTITEKELPELRQNIKNISDQLNNYRKQIEEADEKLKSKQLEEDVANSVLNDMILVDQNQNDVKQLERKINSLAAKLVGGDSNRSMHQVNSEKESLQIKLEHVKQDLEYRQQKLTEHTELLHNLKSKVNDLKSEQLEMTKQLQHHQKLEEKRGQLTSENEECQRTISHSKEQIAPLESKLKQIKEEKDEITVEKENSLERIRGKIDEVNNQSKEIKTMQKEILQYLRDGKDTELENCDRRLSKISESIEVEEIEIVEISNSIDEKRKELSSQTVQQRELSVHLQIRQREQELKAIQTCIEKLKAKLGDFDIGTITVEKNRLVQEESRMIRERERAEGALKELQSTINKTKEQLDSPMYKNVDEDYRTKVIEVKTSEIACEDLNKYYKALDRAIMKYHSMKMEEINKITRELWQHTYRGNDIEYIEIRSEVDEEGAGLEKSKRVYNYKVVMIKDKTVLDMRGRCSAGQKVLASLIIRLALAETFGVNCGILALDEPTTNLDRDNIISLADALGRIVKARQRQQNFQLIVITHDEDFLEILSRSEYVEYYYKVFKNERGYSRLQKMATVQ